MEQKIAKKVTGAMVKFNHPLFDFRNKEAKEKVAWVYDFLRPYIRQNCSLLDLGCGTGKQSFATEELGARVVGIDCSKGAIEFASRIKKEIKSKCHFIVCDYVKMPFKKEMFDVAIFPKNIVECSYKETEKLSLEVRRVLKKEGIFVVTMEDGIKRILRDRSVNVDNFNHKTGRFEGKITLPNKKHYPYPTYFWTIPFAKQIFSRDFKLIREKKIDQDFFILIFKK